MARGPMATMNPPETVEVDKDQVACDGDGALGHPRVYLNLGPAGRVDCPYCGKRFVMKEGVAPAGH